METSVYECTNYRTKDSEIILGQCKFLNRFCVRFQVLETYSSFPAAFAIPTRNKEYHDTFSTLCRGVLLYPQTSLAILLNSTLPLVWGQIPSFAKSCRALSNTIKSALCNRYGQRPLSSCQPIPRHYDRYHVVHATR